MRFYERLQPKTSEQADEYLEKFNSFQKKFLEKASLVLPLRQSLQLISDNVDISEGHRLLVKKWYRNLAQHFLSDNAGYYLDAVKVGYGRKGTSFSDVFSGKASGGAYNLSGHAFDLADIGFGLSSAEDLADVLQKKDISPTAVLSTFMHEMMHAYTSGIIQAERRMPEGTLDSFEKDYVEDMKKIYEFAKSKVPEKKQGMYGFTNLHEFIAEAFSNFQFQGFLMSIKSPTSLSVYNRMSSYEKDLIKPLLKSTLETYKDAQVYTLSEDNYNSVLVEVIQKTLDIVRKGHKRTTNVGYWHYAYYSDKVSSKE